jgi:hypothetical protein
VNPASCIGIQTCSTDPEDANPIYTPVAGTTWDIITTTTGSPPGDYLPDGTVDDQDYDTWKAAFGSDSAASDGNENGVVDAADYVLFRKFFGETGSTSLISGDFDSIVDDLAGFHFVGSKPSSNIYRLTLVADGPGSGGAVPEPSTMALAGLMLSMVGALRRTRRSAGVPS